MLKRVRPDKVKVRSPYDSTLVNRCFVGEKVEGEFRLTRDGNGNCIYKKVGERDVSSYVGSFANGCALSSILDRISLMPVHDKIRYLQQNTDGVGADLSHMPTDATEAFIMVQKLGRQYPQIFERVAKGEALDAILVDVFKSVVEPTHDAPAETQKEGE